MRLSINTAQLYSALNRSVKANRESILKAAGVIGISEEIMRSEAQRLAKCIQRQIDAYYSSYSPVVPGYRQGDLGNYIVASPRVQISPDGKTLTASVEVQEAPGQSVFPGGASTDKLQGIDQGWHVKKDVWFRDKERFGFYEGFGFIEKGIADFSSSNTYNITVTPHR